MESILLDVALDLTRSLSTHERFERLVSAARQAFPCDAAAIMRLERGQLAPVAISGLPADIMGRRFDISQQPRFAAILQSRSPVRFAANDPRPDPYEGFLDPIHPTHARVHACMGCALFVDSELVGALTLDATQEGAFDRIHDKELETFAALVAAAMRTASLIDSLEKLAERKGMVAKQLMRDSLQRGGDVLLGDSPAMQALRRDIELVASSDVPILITGESGSGKELVARTLHLHSKRTDQAMVQINCAALPESIAESELFGHVKGAFSGAVNDRAGRFELADEGTLFLDEVGELPLSIQAKLLRALQNGEIQRVGADRVLTVNARLIAATNRRLSDEVKAGRFRADLFHRLTVFPIHVPALRDRREDIAVLAGFFLDKTRARLGCAPIHLSPAALRALEHYDWPGNVRELEHLLLRTAIRSAPQFGDDDIYIDANHLTLDALAVPRSQIDKKVMSQVSFSEATKKFQKELVARALRAAGENWAEAARLLSLDAGNFHRLAKRLNFKRSIS